MGLPVNRLLLLATLGAWLFYESRIYNYCLARCEANDADVIFTVQSAACQQFEPVFRRFGLNCAEAELELDSRVRARRLWQCHAEEHVLLGSWLNSAVVGLSAAFVAWRWWTTRQRHRAQQGFMKQQFQFMRELMPSQQEKYQWTELPRREKRSKSRERGRRLSGTAEIEVMDY